MRCVGMSRQRCEEDDTTRRRKKVHGSSRSIGAGSKKAYSSRGAAARTIVLLDMARFVCGQFQFEIPAGMFEQMHGMGGGHHTRQRRREGERVPSGIHENFNWLKATEWNWNNWRNVRFGADGRFEAPTPDCERGGCRWTTDESLIYIRWGDAGLHKLKPTKHEASPETKLKGKRVADGEKCVASFISKDERDEDLDLYEILGIEDDADQKDIKKNYRKLSLKYHPDKCKGEVPILDSDGQPTDDMIACDKMMNRVNLAYEVLGDEEKRILYDTGGLESVKEGVDDHSQGGMDPFSMLFGGGGRSRGGSSKRGPDARVELAVTLEDFYLGNQVPAQISRRIVCRKCSGRTDGKCASCGRCPNEIKMVQREMRPGMIVQQQEEIPSKEKCKTEETTLMAHIEQGMDAGAEIKFPRMSEQMPGQIPGDVIMTLKQKHHPRFQRKGNDLHMDMTITLKEALIGFTKSFQHLDKHVVHVSQDKITKPGEVKRIKNEGMPVLNYPSERGDLVVKFLFKMPSDLTTEQKGIVHQLFPAD